MYRVRIISDEEIKIGCLTFTRRQIRILLQKLAKAPDTMFCTSNTHSFNEKFKCAFPDTTFPATTLREHKACISIHNLKKIHNWLMDDWPMKEEGHEER